MRTWLCVVLVGCGSTSDVASSPAAAETSAVPAEASVVPADASIVVVVDAAAPKVPGIGRFSCSPYQTFCGGSEHFSYVCREIGGDHVLVGLWRQTYGGRSSTEIELKYRSVPATTRKLVARTCAGDHEFDVVVNAELVSPTPAP
jgi:hypothetical protein